MTTVSQEMPDEERRQRMVHSLMAGSAVKVAANVSHLAQCIGMEATEELVEHMAETQELVQSEMSKTPTLKREGMCSFDRLQALKQVVIAQVTNNEEVSQAALQALEDANIELVDEEPKEPDPPQEEAEKSAS